MYIAAASKHGVQVPAQEGKIMPPVGRVALYVLKKQVALISDAGSFRPNWIECGFYYDYLPS